MRKIIVLSMISLDAVLQAPGGAREDQSDNFNYGGWTAPFGDDIYAAAVRDELVPANYLLGRKTFRIWEDYWPKHTDFWPGINDGQKYVLSNTVSDTAWNNTIFLQSLADIQELKATNGPDLQVWGSSQLVHLLLQNDLVDEMRLKIHPLLLGAGKKLFDESIRGLAFSLVTCTVTTTGVILANYRRAGEIETADIEI